MLNPLFALFSSSAAKRPWLLALGFVLLGGPATAQKMAPGLWENTVSMNMAGTAKGSQDDAMAKMQSQMASLPPEQRKAMEAMMAKQGVSMGAAPNSVRVCISPEQAARDEMPRDNSGNCKQDALNRSGNTLRFKFSCSGPPATSGDAEYTFSSGKAYAGKMKMTQAAQGKDQARSMDMQTTGRWISADCGALKPRP